MIFFVLLDLICCLFARLLYISHWNAKLLLQWKEEKVIIILLLENEGKKRLKERRSTEKSELSILWLYRARTDLLGEILLAAPAISFCCLKLKKQKKRKKRINEWTNERTKQNQVTGLEKFVKIVCTSEQLSWKFSGREYSLTLVSEHLAFASPTPAT